MNPSTHGINLSKLHPMTIDTWKRIKMIMEASIQVSCHLAPWKVIVLGSFQTIRNDQTLPGCPWFKEICIFIYSISVLGDSDQSFYVERIGQYRRGGNRDGGQDTQIYSTWHIMCICKITYISVHLYIYIHICIYIYMYIYTLSGINPSSNPLMSMKANDLPSVR